MDKVRACNRLRDKIFPNILIFSQVFYILLQNVEYLEQLNYI